MTQGQNFQDSAAAGAANVQAVVTNLQNLVLSVNALTAALALDNTGVVTAIEAGTTASGTNTGTLATAVDTITTAIVAQTTALSTQFGTSHVYLVSTLPVIASPARAFVSDSTVAAATNFGVTVVGSGTHLVPVYFDNTTWKIG